MAIEHANIPESGLHEPKGASTASVDTTYISDGTGSGTWKKVDANALQGTLSNTAPSGRRIVTDGAGGFSADLVPGSAFGTMNLTDNTTAKNVTAAADTTLNTNSDFVEYDVALSFESVQNMTEGANYLEIDQSGLYLIDFWCGVKSSVSTTKFSLKFVRNDTLFVGRGPKLTTSNSGVVANLSANGIHDFNAGDQVKLFIAADKTADITIEDLTFQMVYLGSFA
tara:strand:+ start:7384 stop:8058 length:675 start_codon:yes stop_codon:yes gene_type:complete